MARELVATRDCNGLALPLLPPGEISDFEQQETPAETRGSFLIQNMLSSVGELPEAVPVPYEERLVRSRAYDQYMRMHKVLVGRAGANRLAKIYDTLKAETSPRRLSVAGWAAVESALMGTHKPLSERLELLYGGADVWRRALGYQEIKEQERAGYDRTPSLRLALNIAILPLLEGVIQGNVTATAQRKAFEDCLAVAAANLEYLHKAQHDGRQGPAGPHMGLAYECNTLLAFNSSLSPTRFAIPTMARCDSGVFHKSETHDLILIHQKYGSITTATPIEVKIRGGVRDKERYQALLVRGRLHLSIEGRNDPEHVFRAIAAVHACNPTAEQVAIAQTATEQCQSMMRDYYAGPMLGKAATRHTVTMFRDGSLAWERNNKPALTKSLSSAALAA